ncbi:MAG: phage terminase small subunit P27 family [Chloroflexi bacterium]|nr:phage terminase small subunit P27 family [Chloroflexota bacterium]
MSTKGRKPTPTKVKELRGNPGNRPLNKREPKPTTAAKIPRGLKGLPRQFWREHAEELARLEILTGVDGPAFRLMAEAYGFAVEAAQELRETGFTVEGRDGPKKHPLAQVFRDQAQLFKSFAAEFGMTPSARARLQLPEEAEQLSLADMLMAAAQEQIEAQAQRVEVGSGEGGA